MGVSPWRSARLPCSTTRIVPRDDVRSHRDQMVSAPQQAAVPYPDQSGDLSSTVLSRVARVIGACLTSVSCWVPFYIYIGVFGSSGFQSCGRRVIFREHERVGGERVGRGS